MSIRSTPVNLHNSADERILKERRIRARSAALARPAEIVRALRACERAGKPVVRVSFRPDGGFDLVFGNDASAPAQELDLVKMAQKNG